jgi:hypothetical protein
VLPVTGIDPLEALALAIQFMEGRFGHVEAVQVGKPALQLEMRLGAVRRAAGFDQVPVQAAVLVPLAPLSEVLTHEEQLLARMRPHEAVVQAQVGELLPQVAGHLVEHRLLQVDDFVVRDRQDEVLVEGVHQAEGQLLVVVLAVDRIVGDVVERIVHPAHVPLEGEAEAAEVGRPADHREGGGLLGDGDAPGCSSYTFSFRRRRKAIASRFSRPPYSLGSHSCCGS